jgi:predicted transglutaminase-like cysteine proteinase
MRAFLLLVFSVVSCLGCVVGLQAAPLSQQQGQDRSSGFMRVWGPTDPPYAFWRFCDENPAECIKRRTVDARFDSTPTHMRELDLINRQINRQIEPVTDLELYGVSDYWTLPRNNQGDCEDYVLLKRHQLIARGWPASALLVTVVRDEKMEGHAVLTARTAQGDFILDNKSDELKLWHKTGYLFVMRQSFIDPKSWVALDPAQSSPPVSISGMRTAP